LVHSEKLTALAQSARQYAAQGDITAALASWREALELLPAGTKQYQVISDKITELGKDIPAGASPTASASGQKSPGVAVAAGVGALGLMLWKFKAVLLGLTKGATLWSMLLSLGVYCVALGWQFALGLVLSIYIHEMGHVLMLRRYGFKITAPMFIPGVGAVIRLQQKVVNPYEDAEIGLAGPIYGLGAATVALGLWLATEAQILAEIAGWGAWINLFNLLPIGTLDGGRGFHAMSRPQRLLAALTAAGAWYATEDGLLGLVAIVCGVQALSSNADKRGSWKATITYCLLIVALTVISTVRAPIPASH
jgi:Zn-dependent protease